MRKKSVSGVSFIWLILAIVFVSFIMTSSGRSSVNEIDYSNFKTALEKGDVTSVKINKVQGSLTGTLKDKSKVTTNFLDQAKLEELLDKYKVHYDIDTGSNGWSWLSSLLIGLLPIVIILIVFIMIISRMSPGGGAKSFGSSNAKLVSEKDVKTTFADVAGMPEVKAELQEIINFLRDREKYTKLGAKIPRGVLLVGPPGTGKTLLARAVAGEAGVPFFSLSGASFIEMFVGVGAARVRELFERAKKSAPCIVFIDEVDALGKKRSAVSLQTAHEEREQTLNQLLAEMDGFEENQGITVLAATNRPEVLDPALLRPGRFDRRVSVSLPDAAERLEILKVHTRDKKLAPNLDLKPFAVNTPGFSGADLANIANEAALIAGRAGKETIDSADFEAAKDRMTVGLERKSRMITLRDREIVKFHESGHAVAALFTPGASKPRKVTIVPRGMAGGFTEGIYEERMVRERDALLANIVVLLGGRAAEEIFCRTETTGASDDLRKATELARKMVLEFGMGRETGLVSYSTDLGENFLGLDIETGRNLSEATRRELDLEIRKILDDCYMRARSTIAQHRGVVCRLAALLDLREIVMLDEETIKALEGAHDAGDKEAH